jgi:tRNA threonylcarbamoyladenosine biosynthesis protein TsaE
MTANPMQPLSDAAADPADPRWAEAWQRESRSARGTRILGQRIGANLAAGTVVGLVGTLGAGKTTFVQGLAAGWGLTDLKQVVSPTYTLMNVYAGGRGPMVHIDLYRLADADAAYGLGLEESIAQQDALIVVEWADHLPELLPAHAAWIRLTAPDANQRLLQGLGLPPPPRLKSR